MIVKPKAKSAVVVKPVIHPALPRTPEIEEMQYTWLEDLEETMGELTVWTDERKRVLREVVRQQLAETDAGKANPWLLEETRESIRIC